MKLESVKSSRFADICTEKTTSYSLNTYRVQKRLIYIVTVIRCYSHFGCIKFIQK